MPVPKSAPFLRSLPLTLILAGFLPLSSALADPAPSNSPAAEAAAKGIYADKDFDLLTQAEKDAAKQAAKTTHFSALRVCSDPGNMPLSNRAGEGYENKIAELLAKAMGADLSYFWRPSIERGMTRQTFDENECDVMMDVPADYGNILPTIPVYKTTYVFASQADKHITIKDLDDPQLRKLRIGVFELSALRQALADHGVVKDVQVHEVSHDADLIPEHQPWHQVQDVVDGKLDLAGVWGPFAGWVKTMKGGPLVLQPTNLMDDNIPMEFSMAIGVRTNNAVLKYALDNALKAHQKEIAKILTDYGVPLVQCSDCLVAGSLPAHGVYTAPAAAAANFSKPMHWTVTQAQVDQWLKDGADVNDELSDAVLSNDVDRVAYLIGKGADVNKLDLQGTPPLSTASRFGCIEMMDLLVSHGAKVDEQDSDGWTPLLRAAQRNQVAAIQFLLKHGANPQFEATGGYTPLAIAIEEQQFDAAKALIEAGVDINRAASQYRVTPLMICASERPAESRARRLLQKLGPMEIAQELIKRGAKVDATNVDGVTALMIAAARDNSAMIGLLIQSGADPKIKSAAGETAREIAIKNDNLSAIRLFALLEGQKPTR